jgi:hypothetical protein
MAIMLMTDSSLSQMLTLELYKFRSVEEVVIVIIVNDSTC